MSYYDSEKDSLYDESVIARDILELVDLIKHSAWIIASKEKNPYTIRGRTINLRNPKSHYDFFNELWVNQDEISCLINPVEKGLNISPVHTSAILYGLRQDFFNKPNLNGKGSMVGWYLDPKMVLIDCLPDIFESFEATYEQPGKALALQGRQSDILGHVSIAIFNYVRTNYKTSDDSFKNELVS